MEIKEKLYDKDEKGLFRLIREATVDELKRAKLKDNLIFVIQKTIDDKKDSVLFVHGNKRGKKIYRAKLADVSFDLRKNGNFADLIDNNLKSKLKKAV